VAGGCPSRPARSCRLCDATRPRKGKRDKAVLISANCLQRAADPTRDLWLKESEMCGIVGYIGKRDAAPILMEGLRRLEYRGYDSAGIAVAHMGELRLASAKVGLSSSRGRYRHASKARPASPIRAGRRTASRATRTPTRIATGRTASQSSTTGSSRMPRHYGRGSRAAVSCFAPRPTAKCWRI
jgi:hypothetical protein